MFYGQARSQGARSAVARNINILVVLHYTTLHYISSTMLCYTTLYYAIL